MSEPNLQALRHSAAHLLAAAVLELYPQAKLTLGPATEDGFYYDIDFGGSPPSEDDLMRIENKMRELVRNWTQFSKRVVSVDEAKNWAHENPYKRELIEEIDGRGEEITLYICGEFEDLCRGGHVDNPASELQYFTLLSIAGAYWRGDENNPMLTRIYGTAFYSQKELDEYLQNLEEAKKRDHRKLGKALDLFVFSDLVGPGLPLFTPRGTVIRDELAALLQSIQEPKGFQRVSIPHIAKSDLYKTSGHWEKFQEDLFQVTGSHGEEFVIKPMNCPHHTQIFASQLRSYRDLPIRMAEITAVYRDEQAGELQGLSRVRSITQDDAHIFCRVDQIEEEVGMVMDIVDQFYVVFDFEMSVHLSVRDVSSKDKYLGSDSIWEKSEAALADALSQQGKAFATDQGEAAFYGPKIDFVARDALGRRWQLATIQLDFTMPERFGLEYVDEHGERQTPVMIHRAIMGSVERFMAILLEHYAGHLPLWLSPTQVAVLPISDAQQEYATVVAARMREVGIRVEIDSRGESIGKKIRDAQTKKIPVMCIVGAKEAEAEAVSVRTHAEGDTGSQELGALIETLRKDILERKSNTN